MNARQATAKEKPCRVAVLVGSLRRESLSRKLALALEQLSPPTFDLQMIDIGGLPLYNDDLDADPPEAWRVLRRSIHDAHALLFITPEYNRSIPSPLKNAIDVGSRPKGASCWSAKPAAVISQSPGQLGGFGASHHLRQCLAGLGVFTMPTPEAYISFAERIFSPDGQLVEQQTRRFLRDFMQAYESWVLRCLPG